MVFVLDRKKRPLMPCTEKRARLLLGRRRAVVCRLRPFTIRLKDRLRKESAVQPVALKLDPGSKVTGIAVVWEEQTANGPVHHTLHLAELEHRGDDVRRRMRSRAAYRRRRRSTNLRHRAPRFDNRRREEGWLPPSLRSRADNLLSLAGRYSRLAPLTHVDVELAKFDTQRLINPEIQGVEYQRGILWGYEVREYLLEKWGRRCTYCGTGDVPIQIEHIIPKSRGGTDRISNLTLACRSCNEAKGDHTASEVGHPEVHVRAGGPLRDAAAINATRWAIVNGLRGAGFSLRTWTGGRTKWNRMRFGLVKTHAIDALCVGNVAALSGAAVPVLTITAMGRGKRSRTNVDAFGFPRGYRMRRKRMQGFQTGDFVRAEVAKGRHAGAHLGRVAIRASGSFRIGDADGISWRRCRLLQRADGYEYNSRGAQRLPPQG